MAQFSKKIIGSLLHFGVFALLFVIVAPVLIAIKIGLSRYARMHNERLARFDKTPRQLPHTKTQGAGR